MSIRKTVFVKFTGKYEKDGKRNIFRLINLFIYRVSVDDHGSHGVFSTGYISGTVPAGINAYGSTIRVEQLWFLSSKTMCVFLNQRKGLKLMPFIKPVFKHVERSVRVVLYSRAYTTIKSMFCT